MHRYGTRRSLGDYEIYGGEGDDRLFGNNGVDLLVGGDGADTFVGGEGADTIDGGSGGDVADYGYDRVPVFVDLALGTGRGGHAEGDVLTGIENLIGSHGDDVLLGDEGNNTIRGGSGADKIDGRGGRDTLSYQASGWSGLVVDLAAGSGGTPGEVDTIANIENVTGTSYDDVIRGDAANNLLRGGYGSDRLTGRAGADTIDGGTGLGMDIADYEGSFWGVNIDLALGTAAGGDAEGDVLLNIEGLSGTGNLDQLLGDDGDNVLSGRGSQDSLHGRDGDDILEGGAGPDLLDGGEGADWAVYAASGARGAGRVYVDLLVRTGGGNDATGDRLVSIENVRGTGFADTLLGSEGDNVLDGNGGADQIAGYGGEDTIIVDERARTDGGTGEDRLQIELSQAGSVDAVTGEASAGGRFWNFEAVTVIGSEGDDVAIGADGEDDFRGNGGSDLLLGGLGDDRLDGGDGRDYLRGGEGDDVLRGGRFHDSLRGGDGDDLLAGGHGNDWLVGGAGSDEFLLAAEASSRDRILDFEVGESGDVLHLDYYLSDRAGIRSLDELVDHATETEEGLYIDLSGESAWPLGVLIEGIRAVDLTDDNVMFG